MAKDFAKKNKNYIKAPTASKKPKEDISSTLSRKLLVLFFTVSIIITCCLIIYIQNGATYRLEVVKNNNETILKPKFEFYKILPNMQVKLVKDIEKNKKTKEGKKIIKDTKLVSSKDMQVVKIEDLNPHSEKLLQKKLITNRIETNTKENQSKKSIDNKFGKAKDINYVLQLASFKHYKDADNFRAKLILSGIEVNIFNVKLNNNDVWYRVRSKNDNYQEIINLKDKLLAFKIKAIILKEIS